MSEFAPRAELFDPQQDWLLDRLFRGHTKLRVFGSTFIKGETNLSITKDFADGEDRYFVILTGNDGERSEFRLFDDENRLVGENGGHIVLGRDDIDRIKSVAAAER